MSSLPTTKTSGVPGQFGLQLGLKLKFYSEGTAGLHTDDWKWRPSYCGQDWLREDIKIKRFGGVLSSIVEDCIGNHSLHTLQGDHEILS